MKKNKKEQSPHTMTMISSWLILVFLLSFSSMTFAQETNRNNTDELMELMTGFFSTESQSKQDTTYFHIQLCMKPIWIEKTDGFWLYVEQASALTPDRPYRQRIYHVFSITNTDTIVSKVYEIADAALFTGACSKPELRNLLTEKHLIERPGCELYLTRTQNGDYEGSTIEGACLSNWRRASWVSSDVLITPKRLKTWDRGWSETGELIWGPAEGGYRFDRTDR